MAELKTVIQLRNDTAANWETNKTKVLKNGEVGIEFQENGKVGLKIGHGEKPWSELDYFASSVPATVYQVELQEGEMDIDGIDRVVGTAELQAGDIAIVKAGIAGDKKAYTSYVYDGTKWEATDGNYRADNVYFSKDITMAGNYTAVGNLTKTQTGTAEFNITGKSVAEAFTEIFSKKLQPGTPHQPAVTLTFNQKGPYEVGTTVKPAYSATLSAGSYTYGPATGITASSWEITDTAGHTATTASGSFADVVVADNTNYTITATATHGQGAIAYDNLKNNSNPIVRIAAGTKSAKSAAITGYRNSFYGARTNKDELTNAIIRGLTKSNKALANGNTFTISIPAGSQRVVFAYPATLRDVTSVKDVNGLNAEIKSAFTKSTMTVTGAGSDAGISYKVYVTDYAGPTEKANSYTVTI